MRKLKMIAVWAMSTLAFACSTAPAYADEIHPWCGAVYEVAGKFSRGV